MIGDVFYTPFEVINLYLTITIQTIPLDPKDNGGKKIDIKFNCMGNDNALPISHGDKISIGLYSLATYFMAAKYTNKDKNPYNTISVLNPEEKEEKKKEDKKPPKVNDPSNTTLNNSGNNVLDETLESKKDLKPEKEEKKIKHYQYTHFRAPVYKHPGVNLL
mgnify:CR=1 FL=1